jgi:hypothetical protein
LAISLHATCSENCPFGRHMLPTWPPCASKAPTLPPCALASFVVPLPTVESPKLVTLAGSLPAASRSLPRAARARSAMAAIDGRAELTATVVLLPSSLLTLNHHRQRIPHPVLLLPGPFSGRLLRRSARRRRCHELGRRRLWSGRLEPPRVKPWAPLGYPHLGGAPPPPLAANAATSRWNRGSATTAGNSRHGRVWSGSRRCGLLLGELRPCLGVRVAWDGCAAATRRRRRPCRLMKSAQRLPPTPLLCVSKKTGSLSFSLPLDDRWAHLCSGSRRSAL